MKKLIFFIVMASTSFTISADDVFQFPNSTFDSDFVLSYHVDAVTFMGAVITQEKNYTEPQGWHGYATIDASTTNSAGRTGDKLVPSTDTYNNSGKSACIKATSILGIVANGVMTNGQIYTHSTTATDGKNNYNFSNQTNSKSGNTYPNNGDFFTKFTGKPDAMTVWVKFVPVNTNDKARVSMYLHKEGTVMYDPLDKVTDQSIIVAHVEESISTKNTWYKITKNFDYDTYGGKDKTPGLILATFTTNETPGGGSDGDCLYIDDIQMVYNSELETAEYDGNSIEFTNGKATIEAEYDESKLDLTSNGVGATISKSYSPQTGVLTITVKGNDFSATQNKHEYTVQFKSKPTFTYNDNMFVEVNGIHATPSPSTIVVERDDTEGTIDFSLKNFYLVINNNPMFVGNVTIKDIALDSGTDYNTFSIINKKIYIEEGDMDISQYGFEWAGPELSTSLGGIPVNLVGKLTDDQLFVNLDIDLSESALNQIIHVQFGYDFAPTLMVTDAGWATFILPYAAAIPFGLTAYSCSALESDNMTLNLVEATSFEQYKPYIIAGTPGSYKFFGTTEKLVAPLDYTDGLLTGVMVGQVLADPTSYVLQNLDNKVAFYQVSADDPITIPANRCYLTAPASGVKALAFPDGTLTSISEIQAADEKAVIYDLSGRRVSKATKGIYIINGKKVIK